MRALSAGAWVVLALGVAGALWGDRAPALWSSRWRGPSARQTAGGGSGGRRQQRSPAEGRYIVRFNSYKMAEQHRARLEAGLASSGTALQGWAWVERSNPAMAFPTDFGLVSFGGALPDLQAALSALQFVRDVHPERRLTKSLLMEGGSGWDHPLRSSAAAQAEPQEEPPCRPGAPGCAAKRPGRLTTRPTFELEENAGRRPDGSEEDAPGYAAHDNAGGRRRLLEDSLTERFAVAPLWEAGFRGQRVRMGVFDTGIKLEHPNIRFIVERSNWTSEATLEDKLGHGTFVAGVIASNSSECPGLAPDAEIYTFKVFTNDQVSYTSWFLDAFNYAVATAVHVVNLSIGGPDWLDVPFVDKVLEITSSGIIMVSAIGNDGPLYGTLNNPADQNDVIGIGGIDFGDNIAGFSSRGMSTWEPPLGYGRSKPDVLAYGSNVRGPRISGGCRSLSGTSVASPVVAGAVCLLASTVPEERRWALLNPASMKQALVEGAARLQGPNIYEQGAGKLDVARSREVLASYSPRASLHPAALDFGDCPYMWPFCRQPFYAGAMPVMFNATVLNGMGVTGRLEGEPRFRPTNDAGSLLDVRFEYSDALWPWSGYLALYIRVKPEGSAFEGVAEGEVEFTVVSPPATGEATERRSTVVAKLSAPIVPTPPRARRLLWDQFHSIRYPPAFFPRDDLTVSSDLLDWHGDHPHTNYHDMYNALRDAGYFLEVLGSPLTCFNASEYGALMIVDSEDEFYPEEVAKLEEDVRVHGLGLLVFADWYHLETVRSVRFYDDNTRAWWDAATGGANVPALNDLLAPFGAGFASAALDGRISVPGVEPWDMASGTVLKVFPKGGVLHRATLSGKQGFLRGEASNEAALGLLAHGAGRLAAYGDSNCLDSSHQRSNCYPLLLKLLAFATEGSEELLSSGERLDRDFGDTDHMPERRPDFNFTEVSLVLSTPLRCYPNSPLEFHAATFEQWGRPVRQLHDGQDKSSGSTSSSNADSAGSTDAVDSGHGIGAVGSGRGTGAAGSSGGITGRTGSRLGVEGLLAKRHRDKGRRRKQPQPHRPHQGQQPAGGNATAQGGASAAGALADDIGKRDHPDIDTLAQAGQALPGHMERLPLPTEGGEQAADDASRGAAEATRAAAGGAQATDAAAAAAGKAAGATGGVPEEPALPWGLEPHLVLPAAAAAVAALATAWLVGRRRRGARRWALPRWGRAAAARDRVE